MTEFFVAQIWNLLYRQIAIRQGVEMPGAPRIANALRIANPRYSRMQSCATN